MTLQFFNSAWVKTREALVMRGGSWFTTLRLPIRFGLLETRQGPVLIDTGYCARALTRPGRSRLLRAYAGALAPHFQDANQVSQALQLCGYSVEDLRLVILTHFHADHVSALAQFPRAKILAHGASYARLAGRGTWANVRRGIFPELLPGDLADRLEDVCHKPEIQAPLGLGAAYDVLGDQSLLAVELPGHAEGHLGLCFPRTDPPLLYASDAQWVLAALDRARAPGFPASLISEDRKAQAMTAAKVLDFARAGGQVMLCHDPVPTQYDRWAGA